MTDRPTAIYGATGYTGKLVAAELARRGASMVLSGRSPEKLEAAARAARDAGGDVVRIAPAPIDDPAALIAAFDGAATVINAAGPFV
ncbi:MAG: saccharopine dehydrogenase NADP-binding domain-containing protein, partial [Solirubrobacteraceae bacterium]|nr:saccharopine dehydrogenase NADP-binding domain-containing protein [Solirubrobacteraceae bacterium]